MRLFWNRSILDNLDESEDDLLNSAVIKNLLEAIADSGGKKNISICRKCSGMYEGFSYCRFCGTPVESVSVPVENPRVNPTLGEMA
ncbi:MAG: hypothetical protein GY866_33955 [Proteobacteria bacterium]|nr:hypothetical protein [Pseudomonadota bacterium]